jgi:hypothetical protein
MHTFKYSLLIAAVLASVGTRPCHGSIVARWSFDETSGNVAHDSVGSYNGTLSTNGSAFVAGGISGNAISLNKALNGYVNMGNVLGSTTQAMSVVAWLKTAPGYNIDDSAIVSKHAAFTQNGFWLMVNRAGGGGLPGKAIFGEGAAIRSVTSTTTVNDGNWHQIVATYNPGVALTIYVDGAPAENSALASPSLIANTVPFLIGGVNSGPPEGRLTGLVDEVQIYNNVLSPDAVNFLYQHPAAVAIECADQLAAVQAQLTTTQSQLAATQTQLAAANNQITGLQNQISKTALSLDILTLYFQETFHNAAFDLQGTDSSAKIDSLSRAIENLNFGQQKALYINLSGQQKP